MRAFFISLFLATIFSFALFIAPELLEQPGNVLITFGQYYVQLTLWSLLFIIVGLWAAIRITTYIVSRIFRMGSKTRFYFFNKSEQKAQLALRQGLTAFLLKDFKRAEKLLSSAGNRSGLMETKHMFAAVAADATGDEGKVLAHLNALDENDDDTNVLKAKLFINRHDWQQAFNIIEPLYKAKPKNDDFLNLHIQILEGMEDWAALNLLLPLIEKRKCYEGSEFEAFAEKVIRNLLLNTAEQQTFEMAQRSFEQLPSKYKKQPFAIGALVELLALNGQSERAETTLLKGLKKNGVEPYLSVFRRVHFDNTIELTKFIQNALKKHPSDATLLCALGYLAAGKGDWALTAKTLSQSPNREDLPALAKAYCEIGDAHNAVAVYQKLQKT